MAKKKREYIIDGQGLRRVDKRTPYRKALDRAAELEAELKHEKARNEELKKSLQEVCDDEAEILTRSVRLGIELNAVKRELVQLGIDAAALNVKLAERDLEITKLLGQNVLDEIEDSVKYGVDLARPGGDHTAFAAIKNGEVLIVEVRKSFDHETRYDFKLKGEQFEGTASFYDGTSESTMIQQMFDAYANGRPITVELK